MVMMQVLAGELEAEKERRWKAEQAAVKLADHIRTLQSQCRYIYTTPSHHHVHHHQFIITPSPSHPHHVTPSPSHHYHHTLTMSHHHHHTITITSSPYHTITITPLPSYTHHVTPSHHHHHTLTMSHHHTITISIIFIQWRTNSREWKWVWSRQLTLISHWRRNESSLERSHRRGRN